MASIDGRFMVPPGRKGRPLAGRQELDQTEAADDGQPQADEIGELLVDSRGVESEQHRARGHGDTELRQDVQSPAAVLEEAARARRAHGPEHGDANDDAGQQEPQRRRQAALGEQRQVKARRKQRDEHQHRRHTAQPAV
jgi:hypothetical protein